MVCYRKEVKMSEDIKERLEKLLSGEIRYTSTNLAFNMMISKMQKRVNANKDSMGQCMNELEEFAKKYPIVAKVDFANIAAL